MQVIPDVWFCFMSTRAGPACFSEAYSLTALQRDMQALLSQYVALHHEHQERLSQLLGQLRQYGYQAEYKGPVAAEPLQLLGLTDMQQARPSIQPISHVAES